MQPSNGYPFMEGKRKALRAAVIHNNLMVKHEQRHFSELAENWGRGLTYLLLHRIDVGEIRAELSLPTRIDGQFIVEFHERIVLPPDPLATFDLSDDEEVEVEFDVTEKTSASAGL